MPQFVGYLTNPTSPDEATPVATGADRAEVLRVAIPRILQAKFTASDLVVQQRDDIDPATFQTLERELTGMFNKMGIA